MQSCMHGNAKKLGHFECAIETLELVRTHVRDATTELDILGSIAWLKSHQGGSVTISESDIKNNQSPSFAKLQASLPRTYRDEARDAVHDHDSNLRRIGSLEKQNPTGHISLAQQYLSHADELVQGKQFDLAKEYIQKVIDWAVPRQARGLLCSSAIINTRIEICGQDEFVDPANCITTCLAQLAEGLELTRNYGFGLDHIDLLLLRCSSMLNAK